MTEGTPRRIPKYERIASSLRLFVNIYSPGKRMPTEGELVSIFSNDRERISRDTIRSAVAVLVAEDLLEKKQGTGTFVKRPGEVSLQTIRVESPSRQTLQQWVAARLLADIGPERRFHPGSPLPSMEIIKQDLEVSRNTILLAYGLLDDVVETKRDMTTRLGTQYKYVREELPPPEKLEALALSLGQTETRPFVDQRNHSPVSHISQVTKITDKIRTRILEGELQTGNSLRNMIVAKEFGVSEHVVRTCFHTLEKEGLLSRRSGSHYSYVRRPDSVLEFLYGFDTSHESATVRQIVTIYKDNPFISLTDIANALTRKYPSEYLDNIVATTERKPPFPTEPADLVPFTRILWKKHGRANWQNINPDTAKDLVELYSASHDGLTREQKGVLMNLARATLWYASLHEEPVDSNTFNHFFVTAPQLLAELDELRPFGLYESEFVIMRHTPEAIAQLFVDYRDDPFITPTDIKKILRKTYNPRKRLDQKHGTVEDLPPFPTDSAKILPYVRELWEKWSKGYVNAVVIERARRLVDDVTTSTEDLTDQQKKAIFNLAKVVIWDGVKRGDTSEKIQERYLNAVPLILTEVAELQELGIRQASVVIMINNPEFVKGLLEEYKDHKLVSLTDISTYVAMHNSRARLENFVKNILMLQNESDRGARKLLTALKKAAAFSDPYTKIDDIDKALNEARRYRGMRFVSQTTINTFCVNSPNTWEDKIRDHIRRCEEIDHLYINDAEVTDRVIEFYSRSNNDNDKIIASIDDFKRRYAADWETYKETTDLDKDTYTTIAEYFPRDIWRGVNIWIDRYPLFQESLHSETDPIYIKDFLARTLRLPYTSDLFAQFQGYLTTAQKDLSDVSRTHIVRPPKRVDPEMLHEQQNSLRNALIRLSSEELQALQHVYGGLEWLTEEETYMSQDELESFFGTRNLENYVKAVILPKTRT